MTAQVKTDVITSEEVHKKVSNILDRLTSKFSTVSYTYAGERKHTKESMQSLFQAMILAVFGIFAILLVLFRSFMVSFLALSSISLGLIGVSISFALHDKAFILFSHDRCCRFGWCNDQLSDHSH